MSIEVVMVSVLSAMALFCTLLGLAGLRKRTDPSIERLDEWMTDTTLVTGKTPRPPSVLAERWNQRLKSASFADNLKLGLLRANMKMTVPEFVLLTVGLMAGGMLIGIVFTRNILVGLAATMPGYFLPRFYLSHRQGQRLKAFQAQLSDVIQLLVSSLRGGYSLMQSMDVVSKESPSPSADEFGRAIREMNLGLTLEQAMTNMLRRVPSPDLDLAVSAMNIQHEVGGNLATVLENIGNTIRERIRIKGEIGVLTSSQKMTGNILAGLPFIVGGVLFFMNPSYMMQLFTPGITLCIPGGAVTGIVIGFLIIRKIVDIEV